MGKIKRQPLLKGLQIPLRLCRRDTWHEYRPLIDIKHSIEIMVLSSILYGRQTYGMVGKGLMLLRCEGDLIYHDFLRHG